MAASADPAFNYCARLRFSLIHRTPSMSRSHAPDALTVFMSDDSIGYQRVSRSASYWTVDANCNEGVDDTMSQDRDMEQQVLQLEQQRMQAMMDADAETLNRVLADELTYVHTTAKLDSKESFIGALSSGDLNYESITSTESQVRIYGDTAVVTGNGDVRVTSGGRHNTFSISYTDVWALRDGHWQMVAWHATRPPE
jgi:hypothetical protein